MRYYIIGSESPLSGVVATPQTIKEMHKKLTAETPELRELLVKGIISDDKVPAAAEQADKLRFEHLAVALKNCKGWAKLTDTRILVDADDEEADIAERKRNFAAVLNCDPDTLEPVADDDNPYIERDNMTDEVPVPVRRLTAPRKNSISQKPPARKARK